MNFIETNYEYTNSDYVLIKESIRRNWNELEETKIIYKKSETYKATLYAIESKYIKKEINQIPILISNKLVFSISRFLYEEGERYHVIVYCFPFNDYRGHQRLIFYTSKSEGFFWRLCQKRKDGSYKKGYNYVTTTFINMDLQLFLFNALEKKFNVIKSTVSPNDCEDIKELEERINGKTHIDKNLKFYLLQKTFPHVESVRSNERYNNRVKYLELSLVELKKNIKNRTFKREEEARELFDLGLNLYIKLRDNNLNDINKWPSRRTFYTNWYRILLSYFFQYFEISNKTKTILAKDRYITFKQASNIKIKAMMNILRVDITDKKTKQKYWLYYIHYHTNLKEGTKYKHILNITPQDSKITKYGLDDKYVSCGVLINKIFDYTVQIGITRLKGESDDMEYTFTGDIFNVPFLP